MARIVWRSGMNVKRYFAGTAREALRALKDDLGAEAIVLANRPVEGGVEILALPADTVTAPRTERVAEEDEDYRVSLGGRASAADSVQTTVRPFSPPRMETPDYLIRQRGYEETSKQTTTAVRTPTPVQSPQAEAVSVDEDAERDGRIAALQEANARLMDELSGIRGMIERQLAAFAWGETQRAAPGRAEMLGELLNAGFSTKLARQLAETVDANASVLQARETVRKSVSRALRALSSDADLIDRGGVFALVGPTGVGKTTTTAKIAARCVVRHGADKVALITTDGYRIGAQEQLRIYGRILGVPVFTVRDASDLRQTIAELLGRHMILIDTAGVGQRDEAVARQAAMLSGAGDVHRLLLLNTTSGGETLDEVVRAWRGPGLAGCVLTKVDEAASLAPAIGAAIEHDLEVCYVTNGQRVPEDLHLPNRAYLLGRSLRARAAGQGRELDGDEVGLRMVAAAGA